MDSYSKYGVGGQNSKNSSNNSREVKRRGTSVETHLAQMAAKGTLLTGYGKKRMASEEEYFEDDDVTDNFLEYQPAPHSPTRGSNSSDSDDPLDAYMQAVAEEVSKQDIKDSSKKLKKGVREDVEAEDDQESYFRYVEENPNHQEDDDELHIEYDAEGNAIIPEHKKIIDPLPPMDHSLIEYKPFQKNFYFQHETISNLLPEEVRELRRKLDIQVTGILLLNPITSFAHFGFDQALMKAIMKAEYTSPTPIQAQGIPLALSGRDIIGIAKTGSGKTAAFIWPMLIHIMDQRELEPGEGPIGLILAPTRELAIQIHQETKKFAKVYNIAVVCAYGGGSLWEQCKACEEGAEIIVATPGRLIDLIKKKATNLERVTFLVYDEVDRMFDLGFEPQVRSIANHVRPDRQTLLFSATMKKKVERLAREALIDPIRVVQGNLGEANQDVTQNTIVFKDAKDKWLWLTERLVKFTTLGSVLIFVTRKDNSEELSTNLRLRDFRVGLLHGDMEQADRNSIIQKFKRNEMPILVATDVAARGLDIPSIKTVINYDVARDIDTHTHRIGRTGRAGQKGTAYTFVLPSDKDFSAHLVRHLEIANQQIGTDLLDMAMQNSWFKKSRHKQGQAKNICGTGLGMRERPGLGSSTKPSKKSECGNFTHYQTPSASGPQTDRIAAVKSAFSTQFRNNFVAAKPLSNDLLMAPPPPKPDDGFARPTKAAVAPADNEECSKKRKRSRWD